MKIKGNSGRVVYAPLNYIFQMIPLGGSLIQKFDAISQSYIPDRGLTPLVLKPQLLISDPDNVISAGDYTSDLVNVSWDITDSIGNSIPMGLSGHHHVYNYTIDNNTKAITIYVNVAAGDVYNVKFSADYLDRRRNETNHIEWEGRMITMEQTYHNVTLDTGRWRSKMLLSPFKSWGQFAIPVQLKNGDADIPDVDCSYRWEWYDYENEEWENDFTDKPWYVSGAQTKQITVDQDYIQDVLLRVKASAYGDSSTLQQFVTRLRRWYGQWEEDVEFQTGKYIFHDTNMVVLEGKVTNRRTDIANPLRYFDMELFFAVGNNGFESVGYGEEAIIRRSDLQDGAPKAGILVRELSAYLMIADDDGTVWADDDGKPIFAQFPTSEREV